MKGIASQIIEEVHVSLGFELIGKVYPRSSSSSALKNIGLTLETYQS